jgi:hypothetical protein
MSTLRVVWLAVDLTDFFTTREYMALSDETAEITTLGIGFLSRFGIDLSGLSSTRGCYCRNGDDLFFNVPSAFYFDYTGGMLTYLGNGVWGGVGTAIHRLMMSSMFFRMDRPATYH